MSYFIDDESKIELTPSPHYAALSYQPGPIVPQAVAALTAGPAIGSKRQVVELPNEGMLLVPIEDSESSGAAIEAMANAEPFGETHEVFETEDGSLLIPDGSINADFEGKDPGEIAGLIAKVEGRVLEAPTETFPFHVVEAQNGDAFALANSLSENHGVAAQPRFLKLLPRQHTEAPSAPVDATAGPDPLLEQQWGIRAIGADRAWQITAGDPLVAVAVIDDGVDLAHPDLVGSLVAGRGYDDVDQDGKPQPLPNNSHGTACSGIITATGNNGLGVRGVASGCSLIPIRMGYVVGPFFQEKPGATARCINRAVALGAWVLSNSYGSPVPDMTVRKAIRDAVGSGRDGLGCVFIAATGNDNAGVKYPARYQPEVIGVAATRQDDDRCTPDDWGGAQGSCFGPEVSVGAPGIHIVTTDISGASGYSPGNPPKPNLDPDYTLSFGGTSAACPFVAGVAALILSANPKLTASRVREILEETADKTGASPYDSGRNDYLGFGRVNAFAAVSKASQEDP